MTIPQPGNTTATPEAGHKPSNPRFESIWNFYRKDLAEEQSNPQQSTGNGIFTILPSIPQTAEHLEIIKEIGELAEEFVVNVN